MSLSISTMSPFDYYEMDKSNKCEMNAEMRGKRLLVKVRTHCSPVDNSFSNRRVLDENTLKYTLPKRSRHNKTEENPA